MELTILATAAQREEIAAPANENVRWVLPDEPLPPLHSQHVLIYLSYTPQQSMTRHYAGAGLIIINDPIGGKQMSGPCVRINGWNTFLKSKQWEAAASPDPEIRKTAGTALSLLGREPIWCADVPGLISARVISMIINEAYLAMESGVGKRDDIDTAMRTGTNYPFGPFEWVEKIGKENALMLLQEMEKTDSKYRPADTLMKEVQNVTK